jgi:hypothetical protein
VVLGMVAIDTSSRSRGAALTRLALTAVLGFPIGFVGLLYGASGPVGLPFGVPTLYLLWVLGADLIALLRGLGGHDSYRARPAYKWFLLAGSLIALMWIGYRVRSRLRSKGAEATVAVFDRMSISPSWDTSLASILRFTLGIGSVPNLNPFTRGEDNLNYYSDLSLSKQILFWEVK